MINPSQTWNMTQTQKNYSNHKGHAFAPSSFELILKTCQCLFIAHPGEYICKPAKCKNCMDWYNNILNLGSLQPWTHLWTLDTLSQFTSPLLSLNPWQYPLGAIAVDSHPCSDNACTTSFKSYRFWHGVPFLTIIPFWLRSGHVKIWWIPIQTEVMEFKIHQFGNAISLAEHWFHCDILVWSTSKSWLYFYDMDESIVL